MPLHCKNSDVTVTLMYPTIDVGNPAGNQTNRETVGASTLTSGARHHYDPLVSNSPAISLGKMCISSASSSTSNVQIDTGLVRFQLVGKIRTGSWTKLQRERITYNLGCLKVGKGQRDDISLSENPPFHGRIFSGRYFGTGLTSAVRHQPRSNIGKCWRSTKSAASKDMYMEVGMSNRLIWVF